MDGGDELVRLAELLRMGARTGRQIAALRPRDLADLERLAAQAERLADELDKIAGRGPDPAGGAIRIN